MTREGLYQLINLSQIERRRQEKYEEEMKIIRRQEVNEFGWIGERQGSNTHFKGVQRGRRQVKRIFKGAFCVF